MSHPVLNAIRTVGGLSAVLQPIFDVSGREPRLHALECLVRGPKGSGIEAPAGLFEYAELRGAVTDLDRSCLEVALRSVESLPGTPRIGINVRTRTLAADGFVEYLETLAWGHEISPSRLIVEIGGLGGTPDLAHVAEHVAALRAIGVKIALDDTGLGEIALPLLLELRPDYLKLDGRLVHGIWADESRHGILEGFVSLASSLAFRLVAEGVEDLRDLRAVTLAGVDLVQGFHFARPQPAAAWRKGVLAVGSHEENSWVEAPLA